MKQYFLFTLVVLIFILLIKFYLESDNSIQNHTQNNNPNRNPNRIPNNNPNRNPNHNLNKNPYTYKNANAFADENSKFDKMLEEVQKDTIRKINHAVEQGYAEGFQAMNNSFLSPKPLGNIAPAKVKNIIENFEGSNYANNAIDNSTDDIVYRSEYDVKTIRESSSKYKDHVKNKNNNDNIISYLNKGNIKLMLFYKASCPYCKDFMPIWYKIVNNLSNNVMYEEIDCEKDLKKANEYQITSVPTIILLINNENKMYMGDRSYPDIMRFLKTNGVNLIERTFEEFAASDNSIMPEPSGMNAKSTSKCPSVTFDTQLDIAEDNYLFQIFNADGQYGYAMGGNNANKALTPFNAAYSTVDSYLSSLPEGANISECANTYTGQIRGFGLCDADKLDNILQFQANVANGSAVPQFDGTDYSTNKGVVTAIKNACGL